jgi:hypothetical protein
MPTRFVATHTAKTKDKEELTVTTIFESGITKEDIKKMNRYCKTYQVIVLDERSHAYEYKKV